MFNLSQGCSKFYRRSADFFIRKMARAIGDTGTPNGAPLNDSTKKSEVETSDYFYRGTQFDAINNFLSGCVASFVLIRISNKCLPPIPSCIVNSVEIAVD